MIHIKIYDKGCDEAHIYATCRCPRQQMAAQIARGAMTKPDKDAFLLAMSAAWDAVEERGTGNE